ncbi:hypothetical protein [Streptomyces stelliscabiei]|uniref:hypothetical protein n=1 Tax=Streptomyces stelliscabiei TaxID=146820 RepID=UPI0029A60B68|nr:hypothetical protein [Streptomyces stelliscabiei]MDX2554726.1 hypothetical protein [Streptomyces stelliscabiei]MDX2613253.1 hypothetical protein [Streptomyces stelliscabiei]MDX2638471.1 hypothetical protein [Streptomyces stelliscabiei]MDX2661623.1 hypothetical protein [Streptomyces stelliscabiei]MDX2712244.1 hypothetical protein [Streptomyces stelliscabiei]
MSEFTVLAKNLATGQKITLTSSGDDTADRVMERAARAGELPGVDGSLPTRLMWTEIVDGYEWRSVPAVPKREHRPGEEPLSDKRLAEIRAAADTPEVRDLLGELDRVRPLLSTTLEANGTLLDNWARLEGVAPHPFLGVFCRTCRAEVQVGTEGCPRHSPTVIGRALYAMYGETRSLLDAEEVGNRAVAMLDAALPLLAAVLNPVDHKEGCRPHDCRCACDRRQNCQDCHRCVCWRSECCAEKAIRWQAEDRWARLVAEAGLGPEGSGVDAEGPKCAMCLTPIAEHQGRHCERPATRYC